MSRITRIIFFWFFPENCGTTERAGYRESEGTPLHPGLARALEGMKRDYRQALRLSTIARRAGMSPQHLMRMFKEETGHTPMRYLWRLREDEGRRLLRETGLTIAEISEACGFRSPFHFTRRMKARFGQPPRLLRQQDWEGGS
ncbi:MAG: helix-turn-helix domain-containing protein [Oceanipulchritudo sp.]